MIVGDLRSVLIVDEHAAFRAFAGLLLGADGWDVVGEAADGAEAITATAALAPGVVLLDIQLPDRNGIDVARQLALIPAAPCVVLMSARAASEYGEVLRTAAACGFLAKHELSGGALSALVGGTGQADRR
jgi:DNA-binding NarL/FixJ family response regulator